MDQEAIAVMQQEAARLGEELRGLHGASVDDGVALSSMAHPIGPGVAEDADIDPVSLTAFDIEVEIGQDGSVSITFADEDGGLEDGSSARL